MIGKNFLMPIDNNELDTRIALNFKRLSEGDYYHFENIFSPAEYTWGQYKMNLISFTIKKAPKSVNSSGLIAFIGFSDAISP